ncbi:MAG: hypothetical protein LBB78_11555 [Spirochaetaceae bacterium]|nr:hypothetical protein [Spirochaetaceae bacterium]
MILGNLAGFTGRSDCKGFLYCVMRNRLRISCGKSLHHSPRKAECDYEMIEEYEDEILNKWNVYKKNHQNYLVDDDDEIL